MGRLDIEGRTAMAVLLERGQSQSAVARLLGVTEGTVRYHRKRRLADAAGGRGRQDLKASAYAEAIAHWRDQQADGRINLALLHDWLRREHDYEGSLKSVQRYWKRTFPAPAIRARRRAETPAGAQAQVDWAEFPRGGPRRRGGGPGGADRDAVVEPEAGGGLGAIEGHAVVPINSCVATSTCVTASDGIWCRAEFGDSAGWLRKLAIRQNRWPVVTFQNGCAE